jgi:hypothetical protein
MTHIEIRTDLPTEQDAALHSAWAFDHPRDVVNDPFLGFAEKRAILSSWASDACAVDSAPGLRQPPGAPRPVSFDEIVDALQSLDDPPPRPGGARPRALIWPFGPGRPRRIGLAPRSSPAHGGMRSPGLSRPEFLDFVGSKLRP